MENLAHSLTGVLLARCGLKEKVPYGTATIVVAANLPDVDAVTSALGALYYLRYHRGITHSLVGTFSLGFLLAAGVLLISYWKSKRRYRIPTVFGVVALAAVTHPMLDWLNAYGLRPYLPFSEQRFFGDLAFIVDPYIWLILGSGVFLTARRRGWSWASWSVGLLLTGLICLRFWQTTDPGEGFPIAIGTASAVSLALKLKKRVWSRAAAVTTLGLFGVYVGFLFVVRAYTVNAVVKSSGPAPNWTSGTDFSLLPQPANPFRWNLFFQDETQIYHSPVFTFRPARLDFRNHLKNRKLESVQAALDSCQGRTLDHFGRFAVFEVEEGEEGPTVRFRDLRYALRGLTPFGTFTLPAEPQRR